MSKEEIKALIGEKIAGQGNQVDAGSALPIILNEIVDMASQSGGGGAVVIELDYNWGSDDLNWTPEAEQACVAAFDAGNYNVILKGVSPQAGASFAVTMPASFNSHINDGVRGLIVTWYNPMIPIQSAKKAHEITIS